MRYTFDQVYELFNREGYTLLTKEYKNNKQKLDYISPSGYSGSISLDKWLQGHRHVKENKRYYDINIIKSIVEMHGFVLLNKSYSGSKSKIFYKCNKCNTINSVTWNQWNLKKNKCRGCIRLNSLEKFKNSLGINKYIYIDGIYTDNRSHIITTCPNGHEYITSKFNWDTNNSRCPKCNCYGESMPEKQLIDLLDGLGINYLYKNKTLISPYELDIVIPDKKLAIEYCGLYWHSELMGKSRNYHLNKLKMCSEEKYRLITIFEDEWLNKREIVESRLLTILNCSEKLKTIHGRKCQIKEISTSEARNFCEQNHLQGYTGSKIKLGAFHNEELVSVMTFARPSISKGSNPKEPGVWELSRFCSKINHRIPGVASKLLKFFEKNYEWDKIFSYADRRWSIGINNLYESLGFLLHGITGPNYWYFNDTNLKYTRLHRFAMRKRGNEPKNVSEYSLRTDAGYYRIWDCGNYRYIRHKDFYLQDLKKLNIIK